VIGGLYTGTFTPTEAGAVGAFVMFILGFAMKRLDWKIIRQIISDSLTVYSSIFLIILGAYIFVRFMALTRLPVVFAEWVVALPISPMAVFGGIVLAYLILGCFMDAIGLLLLTVPFIFIPMRTLGFDLVWFGIMVVKLLEIGLLAPPLGIQTYVLKSVAPSLSLKDIVLGFLPFVIVDLFIVMGLLTLFPQIATYLPSMMH
jgi:C4-dicarboxylate transporter DctM subunit